MHKAGFVNIIGNPNVGKSTLMNAFMGEKLSIITSKAQTTRHRILGIVNGDYTIELSVMKGTTNQWNHPTIAVDGYDASFNSNGEFKNGEMTTWLRMGGTETDENGILFLHEDDFYSGDGCYTFEVKIINSFYVDSVLDEDVDTDSILLESRMSWELQFDQYNNDDGGQSARTYDAC